MPMSPYVKELRAAVGQRRILLPSVSAHIFDDAGRLLLVRQRDGGVWSTPGGSIELDERPADALVREVFEETGLEVTSYELSQVYGGPEFVVRYPNGDETQYVVVAYRCSVVGEVNGDSDETLEARYFSEDEAARLDLADWLRSVVREVFDSAR